ncbi:MAG: hypothetical protein IJ345_05825 [Clostridia bacterium]|nr:hypothetical protein [Clostridia bacterium]
MNDQENLATERNAGNDYLSGILKSIMNAPVPEELTDRDQPSAPPTSSSPDILSTLLSNPELISKLPSLISSVKPMLDMLGLGSQPTAETGATRDGDKAVSAGVSVKRSQTDDRRAALLCAMKPYLSHDRQQAIDYILKLSRLGDLLKTL